MVSDNQIPSLCAYDYGHRCLAQLLRSARCDRAGGDRHYHTREPRGRRDQARSPADRGRPTRFTGAHPAAGRSVRQRHRFGARPHFQRGDRSVGRRLILDTGVLIAYERGVIDRRTLDNDELAVAAVTIAEYRVGIELAETPERAADRARALVAIISAVDVLEYTEGTAAHHARLIAHARRTGTT